MNNLALASLPSGEAQKFAESEEQTDSSHDGCKPGIPTGHSILPAARQAFLEHTRCAIHRTFTDWEVPRASHTGHCGKGFPGAGVRGSGNAGDRGCEVTCRSQERLLQGA